jgi:flagellar biosynthesis/type III secretory pathway protein FliH
VGKSEARPFASALKTVDFSVGAGRNKGQSVVDQVEQAMLQATERGEQKGYEFGCARGYKDGFERGQEAGARQSKLEWDKTYADELALVINDLNEMTERIQEEVGLWYENSERQMADLAMKAVRKLLAAELEISRDSALKIVQEALAEVTHSRHVRIRVNPFDSANLRDHRQEILGAAENLRDIEIVSDPSILGGCMIESDGGAVDATLETKLELMEDSFRRAA